MSISPINMTTITQYQPASQDQVSNQSQAPSQSQAPNQDQAPVQNQAAPNQNQGTEPSVKQVQHAVDQINNVVQNSNKDVQFKLENANGKVVVQVMDTQNHQVIRQIPSKEALAISQALDKLQGLLLKQHA